MPPSDLDIANAGAEISREFAIDMANTEWGRALTAKVDVLYGDHLVREARRKKRARKIAALAAGSVGTFIAATAFVVRALLSAGGSAEASRVQAELVHDSAARIRVLELRLAEADARISFLITRPALLGP